MHFLNHEKISTYVIKYFQATKKKVFPKLIESGNVSKRKQSNNQMKKDFTTKG